MTNLTEQYTQAFAQNCLLEPSTWFEDDIPAEQEALLDNLILSAEIAERMVLSGLTHWSHLGWWKDVYQVLQTWCKCPSGLIKTRLVATWLLSTLPPEYPDADCRSCLWQLSQGEFCTVFAALNTPWPQRPEHYLHSLQWQTVAIAEAECQQHWAIANGAVYQRTGRVISLTGHHPGG